MGAKRRDDSCLYEPDAINVGLLLFPAKHCSTCGAQLPANTDYFQPSKTAPDRLISSCRLCRRKSQRLHYAALTAEQKLAQARRDGELKRERRAAAVTP